MEEGEGQGELAGEDWERMFQMETARTEEQKPRGGKKFDAITEVEEGPNQLEHNS